MLRIIVWSTLARRSMQHFPHQEFLLVNINGEGPIIAQIAADILHDLQTQPGMTVKFDVTPHLTNDTTTSLSTTRAMFDQLPSLLHTHPVISSTSMNNTRSYDHFITTPVKPAVPKSFFDAIKTLHKHNWKAVAWVQFKKSQNMAVFSLPFPQQELPKDAQVF